MDSLVVYIKIDDIYKDIAKDVETRFDTSIYEFFVLRGKILKKVKLGSIRKNIKNS